jgi:hypothetical protein
VRKKYEYFMNNKNGIENILKMGASKTQETAKKKIKFLREEIGIIDIN